MALDKPALCKCPKCRSDNVDLIERHDHGYSIYGRFWYRVECLECGYFIADREEFNREALLIYPEGDCIKVWNLYSQPVKDTLITELVGALENAQEAAKSAEELIEMVFSEREIEVDGDISRTHATLFSAKRTIKAAIAKAKDQTNDR